MTELCEKAVIRKATFYKHFGDKTELLVYMIQEIQRLSEENSPIGVLHSDAGSRVRDILEEQIRLSID